MSKDSVIEYDVTDANNTTVNSVDIDELCDPGTINDAIRAGMSHQKEKLLDDAGISLTMAGSANTYTVTSNQVFAAYADGFSVCGTVTNANTGTSTLNITPKGGSALGAKALRKNVNGTETALVLGDIAAGGMYRFTYDSALASAAGGFWVQELSAVSDVGPAFRAYANTAQTISTGTDVILDYDTETFDTDGCFVTTTGTNRFTPTKAGYYLVTVVLQITTANASFTYARIYKNGAQAATERRSEVAAAASVSVTDLIYMNGSTDYLDARVHQTSGGDLELKVGTSGFTYFEAHWVRGT